MDKDNKIITGSLAVTLEDTTLTARLDKRHDLTIQHLKAAILFHNQCYQIEKEHEGAYSGETYGSFFTDIRSYVIACVILSTAALEAYINEMFINLRDGINYNDNFDHEKFLKKWASIERKPILTKFKYYLKYSGIILDKPAEEYSSAESLIEIRNGLVHYKPKWDYEKTPEDEMESKLRDLVGKIELSPFVCESSPLFPMRCMTYSFTEWAIVTVLDFIKWFEDTTKIKNRFEEYRKTLLIEK